MAQHGRGPDSMLVHMSPREVESLQALAKATGGTLTLNPHTGLPEAGWLDKLLPALAGFALDAFVPGLGSAIGGAVGAVGDAIGGAIGGVKDAVFPGAEYTTDSLGNTFKDGELYRAADVPNDWPEPESTLASSGINYDDMDL